MRNFDHLGNSENLEIWKTVNQEKSENQASIKSRNLNVIILTI